MIQDQKLRSELIKALRWEDAHVSFKTATAGLTLEKLGDTTHRLPYSIWQLAEHIRIAQQDIVEFSLGKNYKDLQWPDDYWPASASPDAIEHWEQTLQAVHSDRQRMVDLVRDSPDLFAPLPHGSGQHLFREAMLIIDHEAYHTGQIILIRKIIGDWKA